jgi:putative DNA primase/helicase
MTDPSAKIKQLTPNEINTLINDYNVMKTIKVNKEGMIEKELPDPICLAKLIYDKFDYHFTTLYDNQDMYIYNDGYYIPEGKEIIYNIANTFLDKETKEYFKREIYGYIRDKNYQYRTIFDSDINLICMKNGIYDLKNNKFMPHDPKHYFLNQIPIQYDQNAKIIKIEEFFKQVLKPDDILKLQEIYGYCLFRSYQIQKAIMFLGGGANGKSTVLQLLKTMLGDNTVSISLQDLCTERFAPANLYTKLANIYPDLPDKTITETGKFKILTGGDSISAEFKNRDHFTFTNYAKLIFSANKLPEAKDDTDAYFRRWIFINFPNVFYGENCDTCILDKLITPSELSGLFNWSITGLKRLLEKGSFTNTEEVDVMRERYHRLSSPVAAFITDCVVSQQDKYIPKDCLFDFFVKYCDKNNLPKIAKNVFAMKLHENIHTAAARLTINGKRVNVWQDINFNEAAAAEYDVYKLCGDMLQKEADVRGSVRVMPLEEPSGCQGILKVFTGKSENNINNILRLESNPGIPDVTGEANTLAAALTGKEKNKEIPPVALRERLIEIDQFIQKNHAAGYSITIDFLKNHFSHELIDKCISEGILFNNGKEYMIRG